MRRGRLGSILLAISLGLALVWAGCQTLSGRTNVRVRDETDIALPYDPEDAVGPIAVGSRLSLLVEDRNGGVLTGLQADSSDPGVLSVGAIRGDRVLLDALAPGDVYLNVDALIFDTRFGLEVVEIAETAEIFQLWGDDSLDLAVVLGSESLLRAQFLAPAHQAPLEFAVRRTDEVGRILTGETDPEFVVSPGTANITEDNGVYTINLPPEPTKIEVNGAALSFEVETIAAGDPVTLGLCGAGREGRINGTLDYEWDGRFELYLGLCPFTEDGRFAPSFAPGAGLPEIAVFEGIEAVEQCDESRAPLEMEQLTPLQERHRIVCLAVKGPGEIRVELRFESESYPLNVSVVDPDLASEP